VDQLAHRRRTLAEREELGRTEVRLGQLRDVLVAAEAAAHDLEVEQRKAESDVEQVRTRAARDQQRLDSGSVGSPRELENLQHEIGSLARRQSDLEDIVLEIMERAEAGQQRLTDLTEQVARAEEQHTELAAKVGAAEADLDAEIAKLTEQREPLVATLPSDLVALYEKLRAANNGVGAAALRQHRCDGCRLELDISEINAIRAAPPDAVIRCDSCRRILVRTPQSGL
jgi:predicted  nucleic acid-binding Zn-ribbon protein